MHNFGTGFENYGFVTEFNAQAGGPGNQIAEPTLLSLFAPGLAGIVVHRRKS